MKKNLRRVAITVTPQTLYHLKNMADACGHRDVGRVVDKLVREHQMATKNLFYETSDPEELRTAAEAYLRKSAEMDLLRSLDPYADTRQLQKTKRR